MTKTRTRAAAAVETIRCAAQGIGAGRQAVHQDQSHCLYHLHTFQPAADAAARANDAVAADVAYDDPMMQFAHREAVSALPRKPMRFS